MPELPRLRKTVIAVRDIDLVARRLRAKLGLEARLAAPGAEQLGLRDAVFSLEDGFLKVASLARPDAHAARLARRGGERAPYRLAGDDEEDLPAQRAPLVVGGALVVFEPVQAAAERRQPSVFE
jgi:hypothetical protein